MVCWTHLRLLVFYDIFGAWDPSLAFVMMGGIMVNAAGYLILIRGKKPIFTEKFHLPDNIFIDRRLDSWKCYIWSRMGISWIVSWPVVGKFVFKSKFYRAVFVNNVSGFKDRKSSKSKVLETYKKCVTLLSELLI